MCKIIAVTNSSKIVDINHFSRAMAEIMADMRDGYGFATLGEAGVFGSRTLSPVAYSEGVQAPAFCQSSEVRFGTRSKPKGGSIFHGRISTNSISLINTHPISKADWHLIHNGVVTNHGPGYKQSTSNDSEHVLHNLITGGIEAVGRNLTGYYAAMALDQNGLLHVFRDSIAGLWWAYSNRLQSDIFATTKDMIEEIGDYLNEDLDALKVNDNTYLVYNQDGELIDHQEFESRGYDSHSAALSNKSLGRALESLAPTDDLEDDLEEFDSRWGSDYELNHDDGGWTDEELEIYNERLSRLKLA